LKCPQCGREMLTGYLQSGNKMAFNKHIHKLSLLPKDEQDVLIANNIINACNFSGFICKDCKLITFNYSNPHSQEDYY
jgi:transposase-like protein